MKKGIVILVIICTIFFGFSSKTVFAQQDALPFIDFLNKFLNMPKAPTECPENQRDSTGKCIDFNDLAQRCWFEDKLDRENNYNEACCRTDDQCPGGQKCNVGNDWCKSGMSCNPGNIGGPQPTNPPAGQPTSPPQGTAPTQAPRSTSAPRSDNFPYFCQGDPEWRDQCSMGRLGCGPTTIAMIMSYFGDNNTPLQVNRQIVDTPGRPSCNSYTYLLNALNRPFIKDNYIVSPNLVKLPEDYNERSTGEFNVEQAQRYLQQGYVLAALAYNFDCGMGCPNGPLDHIFVIQGIDDMVHVRDPANCSYITGEESPEGNEHPYSAINREVYAIKKK